eukprot:TRINITY_DN1616_c0_g2_i1.p2 TRINITY_DN1616_c0_g2~~TRINITY_DN1616_c0_g2_i1.p2  ORF type:complete len:114 (+),score=57.29 TRINITY_DN1616_c0_g2_i1:65-406(+)
MCIRDRYEKAQERQKKDSGEIPNVIEWEKKTFGQERDYYKSMIEQAEAEAAKKLAEDEALLLAGTITQEELERRKMVNEQVKKFFEKKLQRVEHDLFILNKNKYDPIKFATFA